MPITVGTSSITFNDSTTQNTAGITSAVTSAVAGNGIGISGATGAVTFSAACPGFNTVGSYAYLRNRNGTSVAGSNYAFSNAATFGPGGASSATGVSGTWKWMSSEAPNDDYYGIGCRVS